MTMPEDEFDKFLAAAHTTNDTVDREVTVLADKYDTPQLRRLVRQLKEIVYLREKIPF